MCVPGFKCIVFDFDETLWLPRKDWSINLQQAQSLMSTLMELKERHIYLAIASYNCDAASLANALYPNVIDFVATCTTRRDKIDMFQQIRKAFRKHERERGLHHTLSWREIVFFDDQEYHLCLMKNKGVRTFEVNEKMGLTDRQLRRCLVIQ